MPSQTVAAAISVSAPPPRRYGVEHLVASAGLLFLLAYGASLALRPSHEYLRIQSNLVYNIPALAALGLSIIPIRRSRGRERLGWLCLAFVLFTWQIGDWLFSYYDLALNADAPFPGYADVAYYAGYLGFIVAVPLLTFPERRLRDRRWLIDAGIVTVIAGTITWQYILSPIVEQNQGTYFEAAIALGYPLLDLALLTTLVATLFASRDRFPTHVLLLIAAVLFQVFTDAGYTYVLTTTGYDNVGNPLELGWLAAYVLLAVCFVLPPQAASRASAISPSLIGLVLPYALGVPLAASLITTSVTGSPSIVLLTGATAAVGLVLLRQSLTLRDNLALLIHAANFDDLTGLANRRRFEELVKRHLRASRSSGPGGALLLLGLDDLKALNDTLGHSAGDDVIVRLADLLRERFGSAGVARLGGDEFLVLLPDAGSEQAQDAAAALLDAVRRRPLVAAGQIVRTTASVGIALLPEHGATWDDLLAHADLAMDEAKLSGGNDVRLFDVSRDRQAARGARLMWKQRIVEALEEDRFELFCQPIIDLRSGATHEYEVLLRLRDEQNELVLPGEFLGVAERFGLIHEIDRWVLQHAIAVLARSHKNGRHLRLAVNLSGKAFEGTDLLPYIERTVAAADIDPGCLILEITETAAIANLDRAQAFIRSLKRLGCQFALDDFGVGFSSFSQIKHLPVDYLKIDGSFITNLPADEVDQHLVRAIVGLAQGLGRKTVAEFVQDEATVDLLRELGVDYGQGFYLGRPAPASLVLAGGKALTAKAA